MFSSTIKISSVSDYIMPSQECVKPLMKNAKLQMEDPLISKPNLIKSQNNVAKITLQDCLACSGCVTTAETILIETQSLKEFLQALPQYKSPAVGISPQSRASLAHKFNVSDNSMHSILEAMFKEKNTTLYDLTEYTLIAISNSIQEFKQSGVVPLLCSECPGWVCYAEKTLDASIIDNMSKVKSPQQIFGIMNRTKHDYIATIMPCYDKKLEAVRQENLGEINIVLGTRELEEMLYEYISTHQLISDCQLSTFALSSQEHENSTSNSYLDYIIRDFIQPSWTLKSNIRKNKDFVEIIILDENNQIQGIFARVYGLKNIANLIFQIKSKQCKYLYVEIMACPMGCLNGGGQISYPKTIKSQELIPKLQTLFLKDKSLVEIKDYNAKFLTTFKHVENEINFQW